MKIGVDMGVLGLNEQYLQTNDNCRDKHVGGKIHSVFSPLPNLQQSKLCTGLMRTQTKGRG